MGATPLATPGPPIEARPLANTDKLKVEPRGQKVPFSERRWRSSRRPRRGAPCPPPVPRRRAALPAPPAPEPEKTAPGTDSRGRRLDVAGEGQGARAVHRGDQGRGHRRAQGRAGARRRRRARGLRGAGLRGYGKLVIIKHNNTWLSAYAHNDKIVVKEQQDVKKGQKIAEMGSTDTDQVKLHFEVRRHGKPVDPAKVLPRSLLTIRIAGIPRAIRANPRRSQRHSGGSGTKHQLRLARAPRAGACSRCSGPT